VCVWGQAEQGMDMYAEALIKNGVDGNKLLGEISTPDIFIRYRPPISS
jgi:hypothetical protein